MKRLSRLRRDESGMAYVFVALGFLAFLSASMLAVDVGMLMTARNQAQNSADSGALAGATALVFDDWNDRSATGPAVTNAITASTQNQVMAANVSVTPADVEFPTDSNGISDRVRVTVLRSAARGNPVATLIAQYFGVRTADIGAVAMAEASPANAETCVKPFTIPDKWQETQTPPFDDSDTFDMYDNKNKLLSDPDIYNPPSSPDYTGYNPVRDKGMELILKAGNGDNVSPSFYNPYDIPGSTGADDYRWNIANCNTTMMHPGDLMSAEPGNMVGPTKDGSQDLIDLDPNAYWDTATNRVVSSMQPSPRIVIIPLYDPVYYAQGKANGRNASLKLVNYLGFFIEEMRGNDVMGRITPVGGVIDKNAGPAPAGMFPRAIRLVE